MDNIMNEAYQIHRTECRRCKNGTLLRGKFKGLPCPWYHSLRVIEDCFNEAGYNIIELASGLKTLVPLSEEFPLLVRKEDVS